MKREDLNIYSEGFAQCSLFMSVTGGGNSCTLRLTSFSLTDLLSSSASVGALPPKRDSILYIYIYIYTYKYI